MKKVKEWTVATEGYGHQDFTQDVSVVVESRPNINIASSDLRELHDCSLRFDRRGDVVLSDDFSSGVANWTAVTSGTGAAVSQDSSLGLKSGYCCKLLSGTTAYKYAGIVKALSGIRKDLSDTEAVGLEIAFLPDPAGDLSTDSRYLYISHTIEGIPINYRLEFNTESPSIQLFDKSSYNLSIKDKYYPIGWNVLKMVFSRNGYLRMIFNGQSYDLSALIMATPTTQRITLAGLQEGKPQRPPCDGIGDVNFDGWVDLSDLARLEGMILDPTSMKGDDKRRSDCSGDGLGPNAADLLALQYYISGDWATFPGSSWPPPNGEFPFLYSDMRFYGTGSAEYLMIGMVNITKNEPLT